MRTSFSSFALLGLIVTTGLTLSGVAHAVPKPKSPAKVSTPKVLTVANDPQLKALRARLLAAETEVARLDKRTAAYPLFGINGSYEGGDARQVQVYGTAMRRGSSTFGEVVDDHFLVVLSPNPSDLANGHFSGFYLFLGARGGLNFYGPPPRAYYTAVRAYNARLGQRDTLTAAVETRLAYVRGLEQERSRVVARVRQAQQERIEAARTAREEAANDARHLALQQQVTAFLVQHQGTLSATEAAPARQFARDTLALYHRLEAQDEFPELLQNYVAQLTRAATLEAHGGHLEAARTDLVSALWFDSKVSNPQLKARGFGPTAQEVFAHDATGLNEVLKVWAQALPGYVAQAPYGEALSMRKFSEVVLRCATPYATAGGKALQATLDGLNGGAAGTPTQTQTAIAPATPAGTVPAKTPETAPRPRTVAFNFAFSDLQSGKRHSLAEFAGKAVVLVYWESLLNEDNSIAPSPIERMRALAAKYDSKEVAFLIINDFCRSASDLETHLARRTEPKANGYAHVPMRAYLPSTTNLAAPDYAFYYFLDPKAPRLDERGAQWEWPEVVKGVYGQGRSPNRLSMGVTVIDRAGRMVGRCDVTLNQVLTQRHEKYNFEHNLGTGQLSSVYELDQDAFDALLIQALEKPKDAVTPPVEPKP